MEAQRTHADRVSSEPARRESRAPARSDQIHLAADPLEGVENLIQLRIGMGSHVRSPDAARCCGNCRSDDGIREHARVEQALPELERAESSTDDDGNDRRLAAESIEPQSAQLPLHPPRILPETLTPFGLLPHDLDRCEHCGAGRGGNRGAEDQAAGRVPKIRDDCLVSADESPNRSERLAESTDDQVDAGCNSVMLAHTCACFAEHSDTVGIVDDETGGVSIAKVRDARNVGEVSLHAEDPVDYHHLWPARGARESRLEMLQVRVPETHHLRAGKSGAIDHARVVQLVDEKHVTRTSES